MISAFGEMARWYASGLGDIDAIVTDQESVAQAYLEAVRRRERGECFYGMYLADDRRLAQLYEIACNIVTDRLDPDDRVVLLQQLATGGLVFNGRAVGEIFAELPASQGAPEFAMLCDAMLVRSYTESAWLAAFFQERPLPQFVPVVPARALPVDAKPPERATQPGVVLWAPYRHVGFLALHATALVDFHGELTCVAAHGELPPRLPFPVMTQHDPRLAGVLARATAVVCVEPNDPADAVAFARNGYGVVAPVTSGAHEYIDNLFVWNGRHPEALYAATVAAIGSPASVAAVPPAPPRLALPSVPASAAVLPLVTLIMPTYNRRELLTRVLTSIAAQTYPRIETIVVNDGGAPVDDVVAPYPAVRLIDHATNAGAMVACETAYAAATGEYICFLPDDDWLYPDHVQRIMSAILTAGAAFGHSAMLMRFYKRGDDGSDVVRGFNTLTFSKTLDYTEALVASTVSFNQCIQHRDVFRDVGWFINESAVTDNELHMRVLAHYTPAFVPNFTCEFRDYPRGSLGKNANLAAGLRDVYEGRHPLPDRPAIEHVRRQTLEAIAARPPGVSAFPMTIEVR